MSSRRTVVGKNDGKTYNVAIDGDDPRDLTTVEVHGGTMRVIAKAVAEPIPFSSTTSWSPHHVGRAAAMAGANGLGYDVDEKTGFVSGSAVGVDLVELMAKRAKAEGPAPPVLARVVDGELTEGFFGPEDAIEEG